VTSLSEAGRGRYRWTIFAFALAGALLSALVTWQLYELTPARWCAVAMNGSPEVTSGCFATLLRLLEIKDHALMMLIATLALTIMSVVAVALGVRIKAEGPGGMNVDVSADNTTVSSGDSTLTLPTPPADSPNP